jgi:hypothetical protein
MSHQWMGTKSMHMKLSAGWIPSHSSITYMFCVRGYECHLEKLLFPKEEMIVEVFQGKARQMRAPLKPRSHHLQVKIFLFVFSADIF